MTLLLFTMVISLIGAPVGTGYTDGFPVSYIPTNAKQGPSIQFDPVFLEGYYDSISGTQVPATIYYQLRDGASPGTATAIFAQGMLDLDTMGTSLAEEPVGLMPGDYYVVVSHPNHLAVISNQKLSFMNGMLTKINLSLPMDMNYAMSYGSAPLQTEDDGSLSLRTGNANGDLFVNVLDFVDWLEANGSSPGQPNWNWLADFDASDTVNVLDINLWLGENGRQSYVLAGATITPLPTSTPLPTDTPTPTPTNTPTSTPVSVGDTIVGTMMNLTATSFNQGSPEMEACRFIDEPVFTHNLTRNLAVMKYEVTRQMWADLATAQAGLPADPSNTTTSPGMNYPVQNVTWLEACLFANLLSVENGYTPVYYKNTTFTVPVDETNYGSLPIYAYMDADGYRLPSEGEWEFFARGNTTGPFSFTEVNYDSATCESCTSGTLPDMETYTRFCAGNPGGPEIVGLRMDNPYGLANVHGNVSEHCFDFYGDYPSGTVTDFVQTAPNLNKVSRGGNYLYSARYCRSANRNYFAGVYDRYRYLGFRLVRSISMGAPTATPTPTMTPMVTSTPTPNPAVICPSGCMLSPMDTTGQTFGWAVDIQGDYALIGKPGYSVHAFKNTGTSFDEIDAFAPAGLPMSANFGNSVALDGSYAVVGAYGDDHAGGFTGAAYLYNRLSDMNWVMMDRVEALDAMSYDYFGFSSGISNDYALIGAPNNDEIGMDAGAAYIFRMQIGGTWDFHTKLTDSLGNDGDQFGHSVSISGNWAVVGAPGYDGSMMDTGTVYVYQLSGSTWTMYEQLSAPMGMMYDNFGQSVSTDGTHIAVGAWNSDEGMAADAGAVYIFELSGGSWTQTARIVANDYTAFDQFGNAVDISGDRLVVGAFNNDQIGLNSGAAYVFEGAGVTWTQIIKLTDGTGTDLDQFGYDVGTSGSYTIVGEPLSDVNGGNSGAAWIYGL